MPTPFNYYLRRMWEGLDSSPDHSQLLREASWKAGSCLGTRLGRTWSDHVSPSVVQLQISCHSFHFCRQPVGAPREMSWYLLLKMTPPSTTLVSVVTNWQLALPVQLSVLTCYPAVSPHQMGEKWCKLYYMTFEKKNSCTMNCTFRTEFMARIYSTVARGYS